MCADMITNVPSKQRFTTLEAADRVLLWFLVFRTGVGLDKRTEWGKYHFEEMFQSRTLLTEHRTYLEMSRQEVKALTDIACGLCERETLRV